MPKPKKIYVLRPDGGVPVVFMGHPTIKGVWLRTDASVLVADCSYCNAKPGQPCSKDGIAHGYTHWVRRRAARGKTDTTESVLAVVLDRRQVNL
jgi:hypothetical protein